MAISTDDHLIAAPQSWRKEWTFVFRALLCLFASLGAKKSRIFFSRKIDSLNKSVIFEQKRQMDDHVSRSVSTFKITNFIKLVIQWRPLQIIIGTNGYFWNPYKTFSEGLHKFPFWTRKVKIFLAFSGQGMWFLGKHGWKIISIWPEWSSESSMPGIKRLAWKCSNLEVFHII